MSGAITWAAVGALVPLIGAAIALGAVLAKVNRLGIDYSGLDRKFDSLNAKVESALREQTRHGEQIRSLQSQYLETQRELLALLHAHYGVSNTRSPPDGSTT